MALTLGLAVGQALLAGGATFAFASAVVTALPYVAAVGLSVAASSIQAKKAREAASRARAGLVSDPQGLQQAVVAGAPEQLLGLGTAVVAGTVFFRKGGRENKPYFWIGSLLFAHKCHRLVAIHLNNTRILIDPVTRLATSTPFNDGATAFVEASFRDGSLDQAIDPIIARDFPDTPSTFRQRGHCTIVTKWHYGTGASLAEQQARHKELYGDGPITPLYEVETSLVYDPRGLNQDPDDPATWAWSDNAVLNTVHYLCWLYPQYRARAPWAAIARAADACDEIVHDRDGNPYRRYTADGAIRDGDDSRAAMEQLLASMGGRFVREAGRVYPLPATRRKPVGALGVADLRGGIQYAREASLGQTVNTVLAKAVIPEKSFQLLPLPVISDPAWLAQDKAERTASPQLTFTRGWSRGQRLAWRVARDGRLTETLSLGAGMVAAAWAAGDVIVADLPRPWAHLSLSGTWEIEAVSFDTQGGFHRLQLRRWSGDVHDYDPQTDERPLP